MVSEIAEASELDWGDPLLVREPTGETVFMPTYELPPETNVISRIYYACVANVIYFLRSWGWRKTANVIAAMMLEFVNSSYTGYWSCWGNDKEFHYYDLNPTELTEDQKKLPATLLIHGKDSNQAVWVDLAKALSENSGSPVFTFNTDVGELTDDDLSLLEKKYAEICALYGDEEVKINLVGHSRGAEFSLYAALPPGTFSLVDGVCKATGDWEEFRPEINRVIRVGSPMLEAERELLTPELQELIYEIDGTRDVIIPDRSSQENSFEVDCGHVSLLYDPEVHAQIIDWISVPLV